MTSFSMIQGISSGPPIYFSSTRSEINLLNSLSFFCVYFSEHFLNLRLTYNARRREDLLDCGISQIMEVTFYLEPTYDDVLAGAK